MDVYLALKCSVIILWVSYGEFSLGTLKIVILGRRKIRRLNIGEIFENVLETTRGGVKWEQNYLLWRIIHKSTTQTVRNISSKSKIFIIGLQKSNLGNYIPIQQILNTPKNSTPCQRVNCESENRHRFQIALAFVFFEDRLYTLYV